MPCTDRSNPPQPLHQFYFVVLGVATQTAKAAFFFPPATQTLPLRDGLFTKRADLLVPQFEQNFPLGLIDVIRPLILQQLPQFALIWQPIAQATNFSIGPIWPVIPASIAGGIGNVW
jgi:hypothetical protein